MDELQRIEIMNKTTLYDKILFNSSNILEEYNAILTMKNITLPGNCSDAYYTFNSNISEYNNFPIEFNCTDDQVKESPHFISDLNMTTLIAFSILFPIAAVGNLLVFVALIRNRHRKSRVNLMILHLSIADMIVTFIYLPTEIVWNLTIQWLFGNIACKLYKFLSAFGFYMSSMVLVCISLDRYFAVLHPLKVNDAQRRGKIMLFFAWIISIILSLPQVSE